MRSRSRDVADIPDGELGASGEGGALALSCRAARPGAYE